MFFINFSKDVNIYSNKLASPGHHAVPSIIYVDKYYTFLPEIDNFSKSEGLIILIGLMNFESEIRIIINEIISTFLSSVMDSF